MRRRNACACPVPVRGNPRRHARVHARRRNAPGIAYRIESAFEALGVAVLSTSDLGARYEMQLDLEDDVGDIEAYVTFEHADLVGDDWHVEVIITDGQRFERTGLYQEHDGAGLVEAARVALRRVMEWPDPRSANGHVRRRNPLLAVVDVAQNPPVPTRAPLPGAPGFEAGGPYPRWVVPGASVKVKSTPTTRRYGVRVHGGQGGDNHAAPGEVGVVRRRDGNGWHDYVVEFSRGRSVIPRIDSDGECEFAPAGKRRNPLTMAEAAAVAGGVSDSLRSAESRMGRRRFHAAHRALGSALGEYHTLLAHTRPADRPATMHELQSRALGLHDALEHESPFDKVYPPRSNPGSRDAPLVAAMWGLSEWAAGVGELPPLLFTIGAVPREALVPGADPGFWAGEIVNGVRASRAYRSLSKTERRRVDQVIEGAIVAGNPRRRANEWCHYCGAPLSQCECETGDYRRNPRIKPPDREWFYVALRAPWDEDPWDAMGAKGTSRYRTRAEAVRYGDAGVAALNDDLARKYGRVIADFPGNQFTYRVVPVFEPEAWGPPRARTKRTQNPSRYDAHPGHADGWNACDETLRRHGHPFAERQLEILRRAASARGSALYSKAYAHGWAARLRHKARPVARGRR